MANEQSCARGREERPTCRSHGSDGDLREERVELAEAQECRSVWHARTLSVCLPQEGRLAHNRDPAKLR